MVDHDLRLGLRALHEGIVGPDQLCEAMEECLRQPGSSLSTILTARGWASRTQVDDLDRRVSEGMASTEVIGGSAVQAEDREETTGWLIGRGDSGGGLTEDLTTLDGPATGPATRPVGGRSAGGRYERVRVHGIGGLGRVWLARDVHLGREVALKELRDDRSGDPSHLARFVEEARITARLEHPGIVPLHDLIEGDGTAPPAYTMRFLAGRTLGASVEGYHRRRDAGQAGPLEFRGLLDAFRAVCQAVAFAHSRDVLHRDLKGQNVILGEFGEVIVVDWGLAKSSKSEEFGEGPPSIGPGHDHRDETEPGSVLGTPGYIAPELLEGVAADRRSDVYSLGAILYLILTGQAAYRGDDRWEILRALREREPDRPRTLVKDVPRALEAICLKAMAREPSARYGSAAELAEEVRLWLADEPVGAHRDPFPRRVARWGRKHRAAVLAAFAALASAVVGLSIATALIWVEQGRTADQRDRAEREKSRAESNLELSRQLTVDLMRIADDRLAPIRGAERARAEIFDVSLKTFRSFLGQRPDDPSLRKWTAQLGRFSANIRRLLNETEVAEASYRDSVALLDSLVAQFPRDGFYRAELALTLGDYAQALGRLGRLGKAAELSRRAVDVASSLAAEDRERPEPRRALASALFDLAAIEGQSGNPAEAAGLIRRAIALYEGLLKLAGPLSNPVDPLMMGSSLHGLAVVERELGQPARALEAADRGLALMRSTLDKDSRDNNASHNLARLLLERARACSRLEGRRPEAEGDLGQAILIWDELKSRHPLIPLYRESAALARQSRGALKADAKDLEDSRAALEALAVEFADVPSYRANLGRTYLEQGRLARANGQAGPSRERLARAVEKLAAVVERSPEDGRDRRSLDEARVELARAIEGTPGR